MYATFKRYDDNRTSQIYVFVILAPILPLVMLYSHVREALRERFDPAHRDSIHESVRS